MATLATCLVLAFIASLSDTAVAQSPSGRQPSATPSAVSSAASPSNWRPNGTVEAIAASATRVFIAGDFTGLRNTATGEKVRRSRVAAFSRKTGALIRGFNARANDTVRALTVFDGKLVLGGEFTTVGGKSRQHLAAVRLGTGRVIGTWRRSVDREVLSLLATKRRLYVGGEFLHVDGTPRSRLFALDRSAALIPDWPSQTGGTNGGVHALAASPDGTSVIVGGTFHTLVGQKQSYLGAISRGTGALTTWRPDPGCARRCFVLGLDTNKSSVFAAVGGPGGRAIAYRLSDASKRWTVRTDGDVNAVAVSGRKVLIGGHFEKVARKPHEMFAQLSASTGALSARRPGTVRPFLPGILAITVVGRVAHVGGAFDDLAGQKRYAILRG